MGARQSAPGRSGRRCGSGALRRRWRAKVDSGWQRKGPSSSRCRRGCAGARRWGRGCESRRPSARPPGCCAAARALQKRCPVPVHGQRARCGWWFGCCSCQHPFRDFCVDELRKLSQHVVGEPPTRQAVLACPAVDGLRYGARLVATCQRPLAVAAASLYEACPDLMLLHLFPFGYDVLITNKCTLQFA